jgi:hypothetical protein
VWSGELVRAVILLSSPGYRATDPKEVRPVPVVGIWGRGTFVGQLVLLNHFRGNLDSWDPALAQGSRAGSQRRQTRSDARRPQEEEVSRCGS